MLQARSATIVLGVALITWLIIIMMRSPALPATTVTDEGLQTRVPPLQDDRGTPYSRTSVVNGDARSRTLALRIIGEESDAPLSGATAHPLHISDESFLPVTQSSLGSSDDDGIMEFPNLDADLSRLMVVAKDRVPAVVDVADASVQEAPLEVRLRTACSLHVTVIHESGIPVAGATVLLAPTAYGSPPAVPAEADGNPLAKRPMWSRTTDTSGSAVFSSMPPGRLWVIALHRHYLPYSVDDIHQSVALPEVKRVTITVKDLYGVVFECPSSHDVKKVYWSTPLRLLDIGGNVVTRLALGRQALEEEFPDGLVYVHRPRDPDQEVMTRCWVVTKDDTVWKGEWPLRQARLITEPVFLSPDTERSYREVGVQVNFATGQALKANLLLLHEDLDLQIECRPGERQLMPLGNYRVGVLRSMPSLRKALHELRMTLSHVDPPTDVMVATIEGNLLPLSIRPILPDDDALSFLHMRIRTADGQTTMMANWTPSEGDIEMAVEPGKVDVEVRSAAYENAVAEIEVGPEGAILEIPLSKRTSRK
jgi:hypothetical protein